MTDLLTELREAIVARRLAEERVGQLRRDIIARDLPRPWSFSHGAVAGWVKDQPARDRFVTVECTRAEVEGKLRDAVGSLPFDSSDKPLDIHASAACKETGESVSAVWVHIPQAVPACVRDEGHEWSLLFPDDVSPRGGRHRTEGCPHCDGQKKTLWPHAEAKPVVTYEAPHHYPEGYVRRELATATV